MLLLSPLCIIIYIICAELVDCYWKSAVIYIICICIYVTSQEACVCEVCKEVLTGVLYIFWCASLVVCMDGATL